MLAIDVDAVAMLVLHSPASRRREYEKALADLYRDFHGFVHDLGVGWFGNFSAKSANSACSGDDRRPDDGRGGRSLRWAECLAGNGRDANRLDLGAWQLCRSRLDGGLSAPR